MLNQIKTKPDLASTHLLYPRPMIKSLLVSWRKHSSSKGLPKITLELHIFYFTLQLILPSALCRSSILRWGFWSYWLWGFCWLLNADEWTYFEQVALLSSYNQTVSPKDWRPLLPFYSCRILLRILLERLRFLKIFRWYLRGCQLAILFYDLIRGEILRKAIWGYFCAFNEESSTFLMCYRPT